MVSGSKSIFIEAGLRGHREAPATLPEAPAARRQSAEDLCVHQWFERQAARTPEALAVVASGHRLSYRELNERANQLAQFLRREGVGPNKLVAVSMERSCEVVVAIFGILKAGGAYVPLDPAYPQDRLSFMLQDSRAVLLLTQQKLAEKFATLGTKVLCLDSQWSALEREARENPVNVSKPEHLIYVIYTSGSTGRPKGAGVYHRGFTNLMRWFVMEFAIKSSDRVLLVSSLSFDLTQKNIYAPLLRGGQLHLLPSGPFDPGLIQQLIERHQITLLNCTPSAFYPLIEPAGASTWQKVASLRCVVLGGEPISIPRVRPWLVSEGCRAEIANTYGPTECTDIAAFYRMNRTNVERFAFVPVGRPLPNVQVAIVDEQLAKCPEGVAGELCIGGIGVGAGYLNDAALTAAKFIPNPFSEITSPRLYKTGDLARALPDGNLEFLGRLDHQVKIRGFRIELQEIDNALASHPALQEAVVTVQKAPSPERPDTAAASAAVEPRLVAYYVLKRHASAPVSELRRFLKEQLPEYMVPAAFVCLEKLPLSPNGKVDRQALPHPEEVETAAEELYQAPADPVEKQLAAIWRDVLRRQQVGVQDNFFELGGNSLLVAQMISRVREVFQAELPITRVFETPTIAALAKLLGSRTQTQTPEAPPPPLKPVARNGTAPLSFIQRQFWFLERLDPGHPASHIPAAIRLEGSLDVSALRRSFEVIARRHEILRSTFPLRHGEPVQVVSPEARVKLEHVDLREWPEAEREKQAQKVLQEHACQPFDLEHGPLVRWLLVRLSAQEHILAVTMHHMVSDGWTLGVLFRELDLVYAALSAQTTVPPLPTLPVQYADYACWQLDWLRGPVLARQLAYWKEKLTGAPTMVELPRDHSGPLDPNAGALETLVLPKALLEQMQAFCRREGITSFMLWFGTLAATLYRWTRQPDLVIGTVVAGRNRREVENLVGCFVNFLPLRVQCGEQETAREFLAQIKRTVLEAQAYQDCPFEEIVEALNPKRRLGQAPLYNVAFLLQNYPSVLAHCRALKARVVPVQVPAPQIDLRFVAEEIANETTLVCEYRTGLFEPATIRHFLAAFQTTLEAFVQRPADERVGQPLLPADLSAHTAAPDRPPEPQTIAVAATFTAEPLAESLEYWSRELELAAKVEFAPYNQVFQELLAPDSLLGTNRRGLNVVLLRWNDWEPQGQEAAGRQAQLERNVEEFIQALQVASGRTAVPWLVCICPPSVRPGQAPDTGPYQPLEAKLAAALEPLKGVYLVSRAEMQRLYPVADYYDANAEALGQIPYTPAYFAALGTLVARKFHALNRPPSKVIVLDCDDTLWAGVCAEEGAAVVVDAPRQALQEFMRAQAQAGWLLCLCSKNNEEDVLTVLRQRKDMPLQPEHLAGWRINWQPKSENLKALASELRLGLDSFVFLDDNPVECAEVQAHCPEVLTLQLPEEPERIPQFLQHCWVFDQLKLSAEDRQRSALYQQERQREQFRAQTSGLADFIDKLELKVEIVDLQESQLVRAAQLTQRTNQFNFTTRRRSETELQNLRQKHWQIETISVTDRFGSYGLVGLMIWRTAGRSLEVDTLLLSCRVLGRGVEHHMLAHLGNLALQRGLEQVELQFQPSPKNQPALNFLRSVVGPLRSESGAQSGSPYRLHAKVAAAVRLSPERLPAPQPAAGAAADAAAKSPQSWKGGANFSQCRRIALEAAEVNGILRAIQGKSRQTSERQTPYAAPRTETEKLLCKIWQEGLRLDQVGIKDDFFALGGSSLLAVRLFAEVAKQTGRKLPLVTLFQKPTIEELAHVLTQVKGPHANALLVPIQPQGNKPPLFLVHGAGGDVLWGYANLGARLPQDQPVYGIKSRAQIGLEEYTRLEEMARGYLQVVREFQPEGPYYLGGYCFGGNVAYEMARQLQAEGQEVALVALLDATPANAGYERLRWWQPDFPFRFARNLYHWLKDLSTFTAQERRSFVARKTRSLARKIRRGLGRQREAAPLDLEDIIDPSHFSEEELKIWRIHLQALEEHIERPYPGKVVLLRTQAQGLFCSLAEDFCWTRLVRGGVTVRLVPGSHEKIFMEPHVECLAKEMAALLEEAQSRSRIPGSEQ